MRAGLAWRRLRVSRPRLWSVVGLMPDDPVGVGAVGAGLASAGALDLGRAVAALHGEGVQDLEDVAELLQQRHGVRGAGGLVGFSRSLSRSRRANSSGSAWWKPYGWPWLAASSGTRSRTSFMPAPWRTGRAGWPGCRWGPGAAAVVSAGCVAG